MIKRIINSKTYGSFTVLLDDCDAEIYDSHIWCVSKRARNDKFDITTNVPLGGGKWGRLYLWHLLMGKPPEGLVTDHINRDTMDNQRRNLRHCTQRENSCNRSDNTSGVPGAYWHKRYKKWGARIRINGKNKYLGYFADKDEAAEVYNLAREMIDD